MQGNRQRRERKRRRGETNVIAGGSTREERKGEVQRGKKGKAGKRARGKKELEDNVESAKGTEV